VPEASPSSTLLIYGRAASHVTAGVAVVSGLDASERSERISFRQVNRATGNRLRQQLVDSVTREPVESHGKGRGCEVAENQFAIVEDQEVEKARAEAGQSRGRCGDASVGGRPAARLWDLASVNVHCRRGRRPHCKPLAVEQASRRCTRQSAENLTGIGHMVQHSAPDRVAAIVLQAVGTIGHAVPG
jgi:hypothetical protein